MYIIYIIKAICYIRYTGYTKPIYYIQNRHLLYRRAIMFVSKAGVTLRLQGAPSGFLVHVLHVLKYHLKSRLVP